MDEGTAGIGPRLREIRAVRGLSLRAAAELAGYSASYLSLIENGERIIDKRSTLEAFARALRVAPSELTGKPADDRSLAPKTRAGVLELEIALDFHELGDDPGTIVRDWPEIDADVTRLADLIHFSADDVAQIELVPRLITEPGSTD